MARPQHSPSLLPEIFSSQLIRGTGQEFVVVSVWQTSFRFEVFFFFFKFSSNHQTQMSIYRNPNVIVESRSSMAFKTVSESCLLWDFLIFVLWCFKVTELPIYFRARMPFIFLSLFVLRDIHSVLLLHQTSKRSVIALG